MFSGQLTSMVTVQEQSREVQIYIPTLAIFIITKFQN